MEITSHLLAIAGAFILVLLYNLWRLRIGNHKSKGMMAPKPSGGLPIIGHLHKLGGQNPIARTLAAMADQYGPIFTIRFGTKVQLLLAIMRLSRSVSLQMTRLWLVVQGIAKESNLATTMQHLGS